MKRWQSLLLGIIVSVATIWFTLRSIPLDQLRTEFEQGRYIYILPAMIFIFAGLALRAVRWRALLDGRIQLNHSFHILNVSYLLNALLPLRLGEVARAYLATRLDPPISMFTSLSTVVVERLTDTLMVVIFLIVAFATIPSDNPAMAPVTAAARVSGILAVIGTGVLIFFASRRELAQRVVDVVLKVLPFLERFNIRHLADRILDGIAPLGTVWGATQIIGWTVISWLTSIIQSFILMYVFYDHPTLNAALLVTGIASLAVALPYAIGSIGPYEAAVIAGLAIAGLSFSTIEHVDPRAFAYGVLVHAANVAAYAILGAIGLAQERISLGELLSSARPATRLPDETEPAATAQ
jgi:uncharacterized protein (TIRG00374 family)